ncbi:MAG: HNH endonuclease [Leptospiraceae bacterium]|nr:HNH endonuclease [Leptospiraceae bacterium]
MRPLKKGNSPGKFSDYKNYQEYLIKQLGLYCSYCERKISTMLAVEHIQPKGLKKYEHLETEWDNLLLACVNCNSAKNDKDVILTNYYLPHRDNTFIAFDYQDDGTVVPAKNLNSNQFRIAQDTINLVGLNKNAISPHPNWTSDELLFSATQRWGQRVSKFNYVKDALSDYIMNSSFLQRLGKESAEDSFFSIWMKVFENHPEVRKEIINAHKGTATDCFDSTTTQPISRPGGQI